ELGRSQEAAPIFEKIIARRQETIGEKAPRTLVAKLNLASALSRSGRTDEAVDVYGPAISEFIEVFGKEHPNTLNLLQNYGVLLNKIGAHDYALNVFKIVQPISLRVFGAVHPRTLMIQMNYAQTLKYLGRVDEALTIIEAALPNAYKILGVQHPSTRMFQSNYAGILLDAGKARQALPVAEDLAKTIRTRSAILQGSAVRRRFQGDREIGNLQLNERLLLDIIWESSLETDEVSKKSEDALIALQLASAGSTSLAVRDAAAAKFASAQGLSEQVRERRVLSDAWKEAEAAFVQSQAGGKATPDDRDRLQRRMRSIEDRLETVDRQLAQGAPRFFAILNEGTVSLPSLRQVLSEDEAALFLVPTRRGTHAMAVTREDVSWVRSDRNEGAISETVEEFRLGLEIQAGDTFLPFFDLDLAHQLYADLIAPVEDALNGKSRVYVIADGALSRLPLGTLVASPVAEDANSDDPQVLRTVDWLADRYALVQLPSLQSLVYIRSFGIADDEDGENGFTGFGAPVLDGEARLRGARSATLESLDAATLVGDLRGSSDLPLMNPDALRKLASLPGTKNELEQVRSALGAPEASLFLAER
ncbi:MAG: tetratricopeptide repeat protein, partial [Coraliomargarita sp.]|nr:tetratricopeptide repeat protein [Coraliomargarita sp.]